MRRSLEKGNAEAHPFEIMGKADDRPGSERHAQRSVSAGLLALARRQDERIGKLPRSMTGRIQDSNPVCKIGGLAVGTSFQLLSKSEFEISC